LRLGPLVALRSRRENSSACRRRRIPRLANRVDRFRFPIVEIVNEARLDNSPPCLTRDRASDRTNRRGRRACHLNPGPLAPNATALSTGPIDGSSRLTARSHQIAPPPRGRSKAVNLARAAAAARASYPRPPRGLPRTTEKRDVPGPFGPGLRAPAGAARFSPLTDTSLRDTAFRGGVVASLHGVCPYVSSFPVSAVCFIAAAQATPDDRYAYLAGHGKPSCSGAAALLT
jgi:hypothetical protein